MNTNEVTSIRLTVQERTALDKYVKDNKPSIKDRTHAIKIAIAKLFENDRK